MAPLTSKERIARILRHQPVDRGPRLRRREGGERPDGIHFFEYLGSKDRPFTSPKRCRKVLWPAHKRTFDHAHSIGRPVIVHPRRFVKPFVLDMIEASMDAVKLKRAFGDRIALFGSLDIRALESNDKAVVEAELRAKVPITMKGSGYILHTGHSVSRRAENTTYQCFLARGLKIRTY